MTIYLFIYSVRTKQQNTKYKIKTYTYNKNLKLNTI